jgi:hypothetical protein
MLVLVAMSPSQNHSLAAANAHPLERRDNITSYEGRN